MTQITRERKIQMGQVKVQFPQVDWVYREHYQLIDLRKDIKVADFERRVNPRHVREIQRAILNNEFYDIVIRCYKDGNKFILLDAQHRIAALILCHEENNLKEYPLMFVIFPKELGRKIYRRINIGKPLQISDHTKAMDDKKNPYFNELGQWLAHYKDPTHLSYAEMLYMHMYYLTKNANIHRAELLEETLKGITIKDITIMKAFLTAMQKTNPVMRRNPIYRVQFLRNIYRLGYENDFDTEQFEMLIQMVENWNKFDDYKTMQSIHAIMEVYLVMTKMALKVKNQ